MASVHNVRQWHWEEKNKTKWAKRRFGEMFTDVAVPCDEKDGAEIKITGVKKFGGDVYINNRKGKLRRHYEINLEISWTGTLNAETVKGVITIPEVSNDVDEEDYQVKIGLEDKQDASDDNQYAVKELGRKAIPPVVQSLVVTWQQEFSTLDPEVI